MAKKNGNNQQVVAAAEALPDFLKEYKGPLGSENIESADVTIPRIKLGQAMNDEVKDGRVPEGALFLNVTSEPLWAPGEEPLPFVILAITKEFILWRPREEGGGILARAKPERQANGMTRYRWDKPNEKFEVKIGGKVRALWATKTFIDEDGLSEWGSEIPGDKESGIAATAHHNYLITLPSKNDTLAAMSLTRTAVKRARDLNALIKMNASVPVHALRFTMTSVDEKSDQGSFKNWQFKSAGLVTNRDQFMKYGKWAEGFRDAGFVVDQAEPDGAAARAEPLTEADAL